VSRPILALRQSFFARPSLLSAPIFGLLAPIELDRSIYFRQKGIVADRRIANRSGEEKMMPWWRGICRDLPRTPKHCAISPVPSEIVCAVRVGPMLSLGLPELTLLSRTKPAIELTYLRAGHSVGLILPTVFQ
jgi:hypothetical protein